MKAKILPFPNRRQMSSFDCGTVAFQSILAYYGIDVKEDKLLKMLGTDKEGTDTPKMIEVAKQYGFKVTHGKATPDTLRKAIDNNYPIMICLQAWSEENEEKDNWENEWDEGHYVVTIGYTEDEKFVFEDPSSISRVYLSEEDLMKRWHDVDKHGKEFMNYGMILYGKKPKYPKLDKKIEKME